MPTFEQEVDVDIDIDVDEFLQECDDSEIEEIIEYLVDEEWIKKEDIIESPSQSSSLDYEVREYISKIEKNLIRLTVEEEEMLKKIANRF